MIKNNKGDNLDKTGQFLFEWTFQFIKNKDIVARKIVKVEEYINQDYIFVEYKDKKMVYLVVPSITDFEKKWEELQEAKRKTESTDSCIVLFNSKQNFDKTLEKWSIIEKDPKLQIVFTNPFSMTDKRWIVIPYTHTRISEPSALKTGLKSLFDTVEPISEDTLLKMIG